MVEAGVSQNISWVLQKGSWFIHIIFTVIIKLTFTIFLTENTGWQVTAIMYNLLTFFFFHWRVGDPFSAEYRNCTFWEQLNEQEVDTTHVRFLALYPAILFFIVNKIVDWNLYLFFICSITLFMVIIPKLRFMHLRRIFGYRSHN